METKKQYVLIVNHENPYIGTGGTEKYIVRQSETYEALNIDILVIFPLDLKKVLKVPFVRGWGIVQNRRYLGIKTIGEILDTINQYNAERDCVGVYIHNIIDLDLDELYAITSFRRKVTLFVHDFCTCCTQFNLRKNLEDYCGDSKLYDEKCHNCRYYHSAKEKHAQIDSFFSKIPELRVIAPSQNAGSLWCASYPKYREKLEVRQHWSPDGEWVDGRGDIQAAAPIKIAFIGSATVVKGWEKFKTAVETAEKESLIQFYYFGQSQIRMERVTTVFVSTAASGDSAMINALKAQQIDAVVLFSCWPETYSFTFFESLAAHCFVITNKDSGNIAEEVGRRRNGIIIEDSAEALARLFDDTEQLRNRINSFRRNCPSAPLRYHNNIQAEIEPEGSSQQPVPTIKQSAASAFLADIAYRIRYSCLVKAILPTYASPKETLYRIMKSIRSK